MSDDAQIAREIKHLAKAFNDHIKAAMKHGLIVTIEIDSPQSIDVNGRRVNVPGVKVAVSKEF